ncbi:hypothetical protein Tco_1566793 [Tanacetum coccineum]
MRGCAMYEEVKLGWAGTAHFQVGLHRTSVVHVVPGSVSSKRSLHIRRCVKKLEWRLETKESEPIMFTRRGEVTYEIKKGLIFLGAITVDDKLPQWFSSTFDPITYEWIDTAYSWGQKVVSGIEAAWGAKKTENETEKGWEHFLGIKRWSMGMRLLEVQRRGKIKPRRVQY